MNRTWCYVEPGGERGEISEIITKTDQEILDERWDWWYERMCKKYGKDSPLITKENCIQDWVTDYWAWENKND